MTDLQLVESTDTSGILTLVQEDISGNVVKTYKADPSLPALQVTGSDTDFTNLVIRDDNVVFSALPDQNFRKKVFLTYTTFNNDINRDSAFLEYVLFESGVEDITTFEWRYQVDTYDENNVIRTSFNPARPNSIEVVRSFLSGNAGLIREYSASYSAPVQYTDIVYGTDVKIDGWYSTYDIAVREYLESRTVSQGDIVYWRDAFYISSNGSNTTPDGNRDLGVITSVSDILPDQEFTGIGMIYNQQGSGATQEVTMVLSTEEAAWLLATEDVDKPGDPNYNRLALTDSVVDLVGSGRGDLIAATYFDNSDDTFTFRFYLHNASGLTVGNVLSRGRITDTQNWNTEINMTQWLAFMTTIQTDDPDVAGWYAETQHFITKELNDETIKHLIRMYRPKGIKSASVESSFNLQEIGLWDILAQKRAGGIMQFRLGNFTEALIISDTTQMSIPNVSSFRRY